MKSATQDSSITSDATASSTTSDATASVMPVSGLNSSERCPVSGKMAPPPKDIPLNPAMSAAAAPTAQKCPFSKMAETLGVKNFIDHSTLSSQTQLGEILPTATKKCPFFMSSETLKQKTYFEKFDHSINQLHQEGRYRTFANLQRECGNFPKAKFFVDPTNPTTTQLGSKMDKSGIPMTPRIQKTVMEQESMDDDCSTDTGSNLSESTATESTSSTKNNMTMKSSLSKEKCESEVLIFCSNDYLGMGQHPDVLTAAKNAIDTAGMGAGGTRNISGTTKYHVDLEGELADLHQKERALVCSSGFVANEAALQVLGKVMPDLVLLSDADNHASMIDGMRASKCKKHIFRHNDMEHLEELLKSYGKEKPKMIVFESVYSMTGAIAHFHEIIALAKKVQRYDLR